LAFAAPSALGKLEASMVTLGVISILRMVTSPRRLWRLDKPTQ
jgi:hypothetical protein